MLRNETRVERRMEQKNGDDLNGELYDLFEVFVTEKAERWKPYIRKTQDTPHPSRLRPAQLSLGSYSACLSNIPAT
jgi:hypothetical protein